MDVISEKDHTDASQTALQFVLEALDEGMAKGMDSDLLANAALFAALSNLVSIYGENAVSKLTDDLTDRVISGEFTFNRTIQ